MFDDFSDGGIPDRLGLRSFANTDNICASTILQSVINAILAPIIYKITEEFYLSFNKAFEEFVGRKNEEKVGRPQSDVLRL